MTSSTTTGTGQQTTEGRSVRDIVEHEPGQVTEAWCRKICRKLLQSLELQYAMQMPHRAITADTVVFHDNGEPLLLPSIISDPEPEQAGDLTALARLIHYAITQELIPTGPLQGRGLAGYSESLLAAIDRCMDPDPAARPQTIEELRSLLGVVAPGPLAAAVAMADTAPAPEAAPETAPGTTLESAGAPAVTPAAPPAPSPQPLRAAAAANATAIAAARPAEASAAAGPVTENGGQRHAGPGRPRRRAMAATVATATVLLAVLLGGYALRAPGPAAPAAPALAPGDAASAPAQGAAPADPAAPAAQAGDGTPAGVAPGASVTLDAGAPPSPAAPAAPAEAVTEEAVPDGGAAYRLHIQPWGTVYVDGVDRGVSPPVKRLALAPGRHSIRVTNPNFQDRVLDVDTANGDGRIAVDFSETE